MRRFVDFFKIYGVNVQFYGIHAATDVNSDDIWDNFIKNGHSSADCATFSGVHVWHNANFAVLSEFVVTHAANLFASGIFDDFCERNCRIELAFNLFH